MNDLDAIVTVLRGAGIPFEVVGGVAVNAHILDAHRHRAFVTSDVDLLVERADLPKIVASAEPAGYRGRRIMDGFMLIRSGQQPEEAVRLLFVGEKTRSSHPEANPRIDPEEKYLSEVGVSVPVARDLVLMKLNSFRPKDEAHLEILDKCGLILLRSVLACRRF